MSNPRIPYVIASDRSVLPPLDGKRLIVQIALNVEHWRFDRPMPRTVLTSIQGKTEGPDVPNFSWVEYGMRCGVPRIIDIVRERNLPANALMNASVVDAYPRCAEALLDAGWEYVGHGYTQRALPTEDDEEAVIQKSLQVLRNFSGQRVRAWLGPGLAETHHTPDILMRHGVDCVHEWLVDDLPCWLKTSEGPMMALPYSVDLNDVPIYAIEKLPSDEMFKRVQATLDQFEAEGGEQPKVITLALHPHLMGVPHRAIYLARTLDLLLARDDTVFVTSEQLADWFSSVERPGQGVLADD